MLLLFKNDTILMKQLCNHIPDHTPVHVSQSQIPAAVAVGEGFVVHAH
jgi:hypothetical protein